MNSESCFSKLSIPAPVGLEDVDLSRQMTFLMAGIVNPMGPTLGILTSDGQPIAGSRNRILWFSYNPFSQDCYHVGDVEYAEVWFPRKDLVPFLEIPFSSAPTLLISGSCLEEEEATALFSVMLKHFADGTGTLQLLKRFPRDPWRRVSAQMDDSGGFFSRLLSGKPAGAPSQQLSDGDSVAFAAMQLSHENAHPEFQAFLYAWNGSIEFTGIKSAVPLDHLVRKIFPYFALTARIPVTRK
jgi:hypothetical protein